MEQIINLHDESLYISGARQMLLTLLDNYKIVAKTKGDKDDAIYTKAEIDLILSSMDSTKEFIYGGSRSGIHYYDHKRDKKGKLVSCKAKFARE